MKTVVSLFEKQETAEKVVRELVNTGFDRADISLVAGGPTNQSVDAGSAAVAEGAAVGALTGAGIGGLGGILLGLGALAIPGIGPVVAAGPLVAGLTGAAMGAAAGGLVGALVNWGIPEDEAGYYAEGIRRGGTLVAVKTTDMRADEAARLMGRFGPVDIQKRSAEWRAAGWTGFDPNAAPYAGNEVYSEVGRGDDLAGFEAYEDRFRRYYNDRYGVSSNGHSYERFRPAYQYGYAIAHDPRYTGHDWADIEPEIRRGWMNTGRGAWEEFKDAVRDAWDEMRAAVR